MLRKTIMAATLIGTILGLSGCIGTNPNPGIMPLNKNGLAGGGVIKITFPETNPVTMEKINLAKENFSGNIASLTSLEKYHFVRSFENLRIYEGLKVSKNDNNYILEYLNETLGSGDFRIASNAKFTFLCESNNHVMTCQYPTQYDYTADTNLGMLEAPYQHYLPALEEDSKKIFGNLDSVTINKNVSFNYEENSKYSEISIYANFKRMLGSYTYKRNEVVTESVKANSFALNVNGRIVPLYVQVYPYRDGSKVKCSTTIPYQISKDGSTLKKSDLENLKKLISKVIND